MLVTVIEREIEAMSHDAYDLRRYIIDLHEMLDSQNKIEGSGGQKVSGSPAPWYEPAGSLLMDIHAAARQCADALSAALSDRPKPRGSTDAGTMIALDECAQKARRLHESDPDNPLPAVVARRMKILAVRCREMLGSLRVGEEPWTKAPGDLTCPNRINDSDRVGECGEPLWLAPGWSLESAPAVYCRSGRSSCVTDDGSPYSWPYGAWNLVVTGVGEDRGTPAPGSPDGGRARG
jgi:hypothetical protein